MFQFPALASCYARCHSFRMTGCPIRKSSDQRLFAPARSLSQLITSFIASESQGIRHAPLLTFSLTDNVWSIYTFSFNFTFFCYIMSKIVWEYSDLTESQEWRITDSNRWPPACKAGALANWANPPNREVKNESKLNFDYTLAAPMCSPRQIWTADLHIISVAL